MQVTTLRNGELGELVETLRTQHAQKLDAVVPAATLRVNDCHLLVPELIEAKLTDSGVQMPVDGKLAISDPMLGDLADQTGVPVKYLRRCKTDACDLFAANVNEWLSRMPADKNVLVRSFVDPEGGTGYGRAILSDNYRTFDNLDGLMAVLEGAAGTELQVEGVDLTERAMRVRFWSPSIAVLAPEWMRQYRRPWGSGNSPWERTGRPWNTPTGTPLVFAGFEFVNSEIGAGAWILRRRMILQTCRNGQTTDAANDTIRQVHLGAELTPGIVEWSQETLEANANLVRSMTRDAVARFLDPEVMATILDGMGAKAGVEIDNPPATIQRVAKQLRYSDAEQARILALFTNGGISTAGGVYQAVTAHAQEIENADRAAELEQSAMEALTVAAA